MEMLRVEFADVIITVINLLVIAFLMKLFLFKPIMKVIDERNKMINDDFEKAKQSKEKAEKMLKDHEEQMASVKDEAANLLADAKKRAEGEYNRIVSEADTEAKDIVNQANETAKQTVDKALSGAQGRITELAVDAAKKLLEQSSNAELNSSLYDSFLEETGEIDDGE